MADRDYERERSRRSRQREARERDWDREDYGRRYDYDRDWDNEGYRSRDLMMHPEYYDRERSRSRSEYNRGENRDWDYGRGSSQSMDRYRQDWEETSDRDTGDTWTYVEYWWVVPGPYSGVGPRGYQRSDERIKEEVCERLTQHGQIDPSDLDITVDNGEVILEGTVSSRREKRIAEDIADSVTGVRDVHNRLRLQGSEQGRGSRMREGMSGQIREGMEVVGRDGGHIGEVKEVRNNDFLVDRSMARDVYVPFSACTSKSGRIMLNVRADEVDNQGWKQPDVIETPGQ